MDPLSFEEINRDAGINRFAKLSKYASERHGQKSMNVNMIVPMPAANTMQYPADTTRTFGVKLAERRAQMVRPIQILSFAA